MEMTSSSSIRPSGSPGRVELPFRPSKSRLRACGNISRNAVLEPGADHGQKRPAELKFKLADILRPGKCTRSLRPRRKDRFGGTGDHGFSAIFRRPRPAEFLTNAMRYPAGAGEKHTEKKQNVNVSRRKQIGSALWGRTSSRWRSIKETRRTQFLDSRPSRRLKTETEGNGACAGRIGRDRETGDREAGWRGDRKNRDRVSEAVRHSILISPRMRCRNAQGGIEDLPQPVFPRCRIGRRTAPAPVRLRRANYLVTYPNLMILKFTKETTSCAESPGVSAERDEL